MKESFTFEYSKNIVFEESGEEITVIVKIGNASPDKNRDTLVEVIEVMFEELKGHL